MNGCSAQSLALECAIVSSCPWASRLMATGPHDPHHSRAGNVRLGVSVRRAARGAGISGPGTRLRRLTTACRRPQQARSLREVGLRARLPYADDLVCQGALPGCRDFWLLVGPDDIVVPMLLLNLVPQRQRRHDVADRATTSCRYCCSRWGFYDIVGPTLLSGLGWPHPY